MKKTLTLISLFLTTLLVATAIAAYWIYSNTVTVNVQQYTLTLTASPTTVQLYQNVTLTATLTLNGNPVPGATINFYRLNGTTRIPLGSNTTNNNGIAVYTWNATTPGNITFQAGYYTP